MGFRPEQEPGILISSGSYKNSFNFLSLHQRTWYSQFSASS